ncbi:MAG: MBL fold metallo-hydrolase [Deltaproteobacteria bacterium]|jgi:L-ascorbate metabolism protein UlaG (beta-lactamase superfamily)|nr:MBL fold metallo-hydrolase [Deltaproteobacteria bacterium]
MDNNEERTLTPKSPESESLAEDARDGAAKDMPQGDKGQLPESAPEATPKEEKKKKGCLKRMLLWTLLVLVSLSLAIVIAGVLYLRLPKFGALPEGERLERVQSSPHYRDGKFQNIHPTGEVVNPDRKDRSLLDFFFRKGRLEPKEPLPAVKSDLKGLSEGQIVWFGHSSFLLKLGGRHFLVDPVLSVHASPTGFGVTAFKGTSIYAAEDFPYIDYLLISHDHWDHLDYPTIMALKPTIGKVVCGLGIGAHFERWGFPSDSLLEDEWGHEFRPEPSLSIRIMYARHFSGRGLKWNQAMWAGFLIEAGGLRVFYSGDGGYASHFAEAGEEFGPFDLALLEDGQYDLAWHDIHMLPEETVQAALDLRAKAAIPVHNSKFNIAYHDWDDPLVRARRSANEKGVNLLTPIIGQILDIAAPMGAQDQWWAGRE